MAPEPNQQEPFKPSDPSSSDFEQVLSSLPSAGLLGALVLTLWP